MRLGATARSAKRLDAFTSAMLETALWAETDGDDPLDKNYSVSDLAPQVLAALTAEAARFQEQNWDDLSDDTSQAGHDFWLTRNGHGAGFWDGDWPEPAATRLTNASKRYGQVDLYVGDDGKIWAMGYERMNGLGATTRRTSSDYNAAVQVASALKVDDAAARTIVRYMARAEAGPGRSTEEWLEAINIVMEAHGVEVIRGRHLNGGFWMDAILAYVNMGDPYITTVLYDVGTGQTSIGAWGDWLEAYEAEHGPVE